MFRAILRFFLLFLFGLPLFLALQGCNKPDYSDIPKIELLSFEKFFLRESFDAQDSLVFVLKFKDGDGDLGLNPEDAPTVDFNIVYDSNGDTIFFDESGNEKFNCYDWDKGLFYRIQTNKKFYNLFIEVDKKINGQFVKQDNSCFAIRAYRFQRLAPTNYVGPIDVKYTLVSKLDMPSNDSDALPDRVFVINERDILRFRIKITDRKLHTSNEVVTPEFRVR